MAWFKVDDKAHSNNKIRRVLAEDPAALALWTVAGSWSSDNTTDGFVPDHQLPWLLPARSVELAQVLVNARLWRRVRGGYQFHQWDVDGDGTKRNPLASELREMREKKAEAGRKGGLNSGKTRSKTEARASASAGARAQGSLEPPSHPIPDQEQKTSSSVGATRASRIPADWQPSPELVAWARKECPNVDGTYETKQFVGYWLAKSGKDATKLSWDITFQTWFRRAQKEAGAKQQRGGNRLAGADTRNGEIDWNDPEMLRF